MPIETISDNSTPNPEITYDANGSEIISKSIPKRDPNGRFVSEERLQELNAPVAEPIEKLEVPTEVPKNANAEARKIYLEAEKAKRRATEMEKRASANLSKVEAFEKARALAETGEDPLAILVAAGLDPTKFYQAMTNYALSDKHKPEDPVQKELREHKLQLDMYRKKLEDQETASNEKEELASHNQVITSTVIPLLQNNQEKYETLLLEYGNNAAVEVYKTVWEIYKQTGKARKFEEVADEMEEYWSKKVEDGLNNASKLKKFKRMFANEPTNEYRNEYSERKETPQSSQTLSNKQITSTAKSTYDRYLSRDERAAEILKRFG